MTSLIQILKWFVPNAEPTADQFRQTWTSFWHKSEKLPIEQILGLRNEIDKATTKFKGWHTNLAALQAEYPQTDNKKDFFAWVGSPYPGTVYKVNADGGAWTNTGEVPTQEEIDLTEYAKKTEVATKTPILETLQQGSYNYYNNYRWQKGKTGFAHHDLIDDSTIKEVSENIFFEYKGKYLEVAPAVTGIARDYRIVVPIDLPIGSKYRVTAEFHLESISYLDVKVLNADGSSIDPSTVRLTNGFTVYTFEGQLTTAQEKLYLFFALQPPVNITGARIRLGRVYVGTANKGSLDGDNIQIDQLQADVDDKITDTNLSLSANTAFKGILSYDPSERMALAHIKDMEIVVNDITFPSDTITIGLLGWVPSLQKISVLLRNKRTNAPFTTIRIGENITQKPTGIQTYEAYFPDRYVSYIRFTIDWSAGAWRGTNENYYENAASTIVPQLTKSSESQRFSYIKGSEIFTQAGGLTAAGITNDSNFRNTGFRLASDIGYVVVRNFPASSNTGLIGWFEKRGEGYVPLQIITGGAGLNFNYNKFDKPYGATHYMAVTLSDAYAATSAQKPATNSFVIEPVTLKSISSTLQRTVGNNTYVARQILNPPLFKKEPGEETKILFIGSSWMQDTWYLCNKVWAASGVNVTIGGVYFGGLDYSQSVDFYKNNSQIEFLFSQNNEDWRDLSPSTLKDALEYRDWDIIVIGQSAQESFYWEKYQPYMKQWISILKRNCPNPNVFIAMNHTWTPGRNGPYIAAYGFENQQQMWAATLDAITKASHQSGIDLIIPCGMAVYSARTSSLQDANDLTRDQLHLNTGIGRYITACTVFEALIKPVYGVSVKGNTYRDSTSSSGQTPVTDINAPIVQQCAVSACANRFDYTEFNGV